MTAAELNAVLGPMWVEMKRGADALERIAGSLERMEAAGNAVAELDAAGCAHPVEKRLALGTVGSGWQCECGHRELPQGGIDG